MDRQTSRPVNPGDFLAEFIKDKEKLVVHPGTSQYTIGGISARGLASLNFARLVLNREREGIQGAADIASVQTVEDVVFTAPNGRSKYMRILSNRLYLG
ncbi:uncharacterized protein ARMOST_07267 [Armillaria ostoyae]|uniref:Uncharacterized protein n=1 Tax=Armillaria ostoyae TaxID=47428 RepID=A0A284R5B3_ARMOS|nr:uncharacterized protein ARMOST_07267 [Armillaria ostoyae]